jgi:hypothetical protein
LGSREDGEKTKWLLDWDEERLSPQSQEASRHLTVRQWAGNPEAKPTFRYGPNSDECIARPVKGVAAAPRQRGPERLHAARISAIPGSPALLLTN